MEQGSETAENIKGNKTKCIFFFSCNAFRRFLSRVIKTSDILHTANMFCSWSNCFHLKRTLFTRSSKFELRRVANIVGKGENAGYQHFLLFLQCLQKASLSGSLKVGIVW